MRKKKEKGKIDYFRIVWLGGLLSILTLILVIVIRYKVYYERSIGYVYFYECEKSICISTDKKVVGDKTVYSKYRYDTEVPDVKMLGNNLVVIDNTLLFNCITNKTISNSYSQYIVVGDKILAFNGTKWGILDNEGKVIMEPTYDNLTSTDGKYFMVADYSTNEYKIIDKDNKVLLEGYNYLYEYNDVVVGIKNKKVVIMDINANKLIDRELDTYEDVDPINVSYDSNTLYIRIYKEDKYYKYSYDIANRKLEAMNS